MSCSDRRPPARTRALVCRDEPLVPEGEADVVQTLQQAPAGVVVDLERGDDITGGHGAGDEVHRDRGARVVLEELPQQLHVVLTALGGEKPLLPAVSAE